uniref:RRM domain-containing protein n=1 Tax=Panagrellus redivivus TaxID=6233 RepID=A0A7E4VBS3_PANRE
MLRRLTRNLRRLATSQGSRPNDVVAFAPRNLRPSPLVLVVVLVRGAGGPLTAHPNGGAPSGLLVASAFGSGRPTASVGMMSTSEPKKPKLDASLCSPCMTTVPAASIAAVAAQQATAANLRAAAAAVAAAAVSFPGPASTSSASTSSDATPSENHAASTSAPNGTSSAPSDPPFSRVVHLRNIPSDMTELELVHFCLPFGKLVNYLMLKGKNQAFVEYQDDAGAATIVNVAQACPMAIRGRTIFCQYSTHQELKTERKGACKNGSIFGDSMLSAFGKFCES